MARSRGATCAGRVRRRVMANSIRRPPGAPRTVPGTVDGRVSAGPSGGNGYDGATARWSYFAIESRRLARHLPACSTSLSASDWLTRRREGAERGIAVLTRPVGQGCTRRRKRAPRAMRQTRTRVNVSENCYNPVCTSCRRAQALGYGRRSPPAWAISDKTSSVPIRRTRADPCSIPASKAKPACADYSRQDIIRADPSYPCRSVFYSSFQGEARLRRWCESNGMQAKSRITASGAQVRAIGSFPMIQHNVA